MSWYYSQGTERLGPVTESEWQNLIASGTIKPETLVWREGMTDWQPFSKISGGEASPATADAQSVCGECGKATPSDDLVPIGGRQICSECKPVVLQRMKEGAPGAVSDEDPEALTQSILERGYSVQIASCFKRGLALVKSRFWLCVGTTFILYLVMMAASAIPCLGVFASMVINGPVIGGLYWFFLKLNREGDATIGDGFEGFSRQFVQLMLCTVVSTMIIMLLFIPAGIFMVIGVEAEAEQLPMMAVIAYLIALIPVAYLGVAWMFALPLIIDKRFDFWPAMQASRRVVNRHWFQVFGLLLVFGLAMMGVTVLLGGVAVLFGVGLESVAEGAAVAGMFLPLALMFVLVFLCMPVFFAAITYAYEDIFVSVPGKME